MLFCQEVRMKRIRMGLDVVGRTDTEDPRRSELYRQTEPKRIAGLKAEEKARKSLADKKRRKASALIPCPECGSKFSNQRVIAWHLMCTHGRPSRWMAIKRKERNEAL